VNLNLDNKIIIVTHGANRIGRGIVKALAAENAVPVIVDSNELDNLKTLENIGSKGFQVVAELANPDECENAIRKIVEKFNHIDGLVNNGDAPGNIDLGKENSEEFIASLHRNLVHYYLMAHHALPYLKQSQGAIVNIGSKTDGTGKRDTSEYAASNGGKNALTREWAVELLPYSIRVNAVIVAEYCTPEEIANMAIFLLSERSSHTTGQLIHTDGG
jgi:NAD(P)-dependent dehydrogenase (short-subunit alcohol dehydrogenase family)